MKDPDPNAGDAAAGPSADGKPSTQSVSRTPNRFAGDLWLLSNFDNPNDRYAKFLAQGRPRLKQLLESILLHPTTYIPTEDFLSLAVLVGTLGERAVIALLDSGRVRFVRVRGSLAYIGNGGGIRHYEIFDKDVPTHHCAPLDQSIAWALGGLAVKPTDPRLPALVLEKSQELSITQVSAAVRHETYTDILGSPELREFFGLRNTDMDHLAGVAKNGVRIYGGADAAWTGDEIDVVMAVATANLELRLAEITGAVDASTVTPVGNLLKAKAERVYGRDAAASFTELSEIAGIADVGEAVLQNVVSVEQLIKLSDSPDGQQFQAWFHDHCRTDTLTSAREYNRLLSAIPRIQSFPVKALRFIATAALGKIPVIGEIASGIDSFFLERWLRGRSPKFFLDDLIKLTQRRHR